MPQTSTDNNHRSEANKYYNWGKEHSKLNKPSDAIQSYDLAIKHLNQIQQQTPEDQVRLLNCFSGMGFSQYLLEQYPAAISAYYSAISMQPQHEDTDIEEQTNFAELYNLLGLALDRNQQCQEGIEAIQTAIEMLERIPNPLDNHRVRLACYYCNIATINFDVCHDNNNACINIKKAIEMYSKIQNPEEVDRREHSDYYYIYGRVLLRLSENEQAKSCLLNAIALKKECQPTTDEERFEFVENYMKLGECYFVLKQPVDALEAYLQAIEWQPRDIEEPVAKARRLFQAIRVALDKISWQYFEGSEKQRITRIISCWFADRYKAKKYFLKNALAITNDYLASLDDDLLKSLLLVLKMIRQSQTIFPVQALREFNEDEMRQLNQIIDNLTNSIASLNMLKNRAAVSTLLAQQQQISMLQKEIQSIKGQIHLQAAASSSSQPAPADDADLKKRKRSEEQGQRKITDFFSRENKRRPEKPQRSSLSISM